MNTRSWPIGAAIAAFTALLLTWQVHARTGDETFMCVDVGECSLGSGWSWLLTGATLTGPWLALVGAAWSRHLHNSDRLGPFSARAIPDGEQIVEVIAVLLAGLFSYWLVRSGPSIEPALPHDLGRANRWALDVRNLRLDDGEAAVTSVPARRTWFILGAVLFAPFAASLGSMLGREFYGRRRRAAQRLADEDAPAAEA